MTSFIQTLLQDAQHREAMDSLHLADRSSLMSEIHQLRGQLERLHHGESTGLGLMEKREGGGGDRGAESDRLLLEELKGELSQTKLELETTLKAQHKHLKEMDTLRLDGMWFDRRVASQKARENPLLTSVALIRKSQMFRQLFSLLLLPVSINPKLEYILTNLEMSQHRCQQRVMVGRMFKSHSRLSVARAEVSQKAAEVDALADRLTEEKKRSRDLQWAAEKERCETDRKEESKREELEVRERRNGNRIHC